MTNDMTVQGLNLAAPIVRKEHIDLVATPEAKKPLQDLSIDKGLRSALAQEQPLRRGELEQTVRDMNSLVQDLQRQVRFSLDDASGEMIVKVVDRATDDVIREIPSEEVLRIRRRLEEATGAIFSDRV